MSSLLPKWATKAQTFEERKNPVVASMEGGRVILEAENGTLDYENGLGNSNWKLAKPEGASGKGVLLWAGGDNFGGNNAGQEHVAPLTYYFEVDAPGTYHLTLRAIRPETGEPNDRNNDFFVEMPGQDWKKLYFHGTREEFAFGTKVDVAAGHFTATFTVTQSQIDANDGVFELGLSGRSAWAGLDQIHIQKDSGSRDHNAAASEVTPYADAAAKIPGHLLIGTKRKDKVDGSDSVEHIKTGDGNDKVDAKGGADLIWGGDGEDLLLGGSGNDQISGGRGDDEIDGGNNNDTLNGGKGRDVLMGGNGADTLDGGGGNDKMFGGGGADTFVLKKNKGADKIHDFNTSADSLLIIGVGENFQLENKARMKKDVVELSLGGETIKIFGVDDIADIDYSLG